MLKGQGPFVCPIIDSLMGFTHQAVSIAPRREIEVAGQNEYEFVNESLLIYLMASLSSSIRVFLNVSLHLWMETAINPF